MIATNLLSGVPNTVGADVVFVMGTKAQSIKLAVVIDGEKKPSHWFVAGEVVNLGGHEWRVVELNDKRTGTDLPGSGAGKIAAVLERDDD